MLRRSLHECWSSPSFGEAQPGEPPWRPAVGWWCDRVHVVTGSRKRPCDKGVRVPHVTRAELVASPGQRRNLREQYQNCSCLSRVFGDPPRLADSLGDVRDGPARPAPDFIAEGAGPAEHTRPDRPLADDAATWRGDVPHRSHLDCVGHAAGADLQGGVVQAAPGSSLMSGDNTLVDAAVPADTAPACAERKPVQVDPRRAHISDRRRHARTPSARAAGRATREEHRYYPQRESPRRTPGSRHLTLPRRSNMAREWPDRGPR